MSTLEVISRLCGVTESLAEIVKRQREVIECSRIEEEAKEQLRKESEDAESELDVLEYHMRKLCDMDDIEANGLSIYDVEVTVTTMMEVEAMSKNDAEEKARREYVDFIHISPKTIYAKKRGE